MRNAISLAQNTMIQLNPRDQEDDNVLPMVFNPDLAGIVKSIEHKMAEEEKLKQERIERSRRQSSEQLSPRYNVD